MTTFLCVKGSKPHEVLLDTVNEAGQTLTHLHRAASRFDAYVLASRIVANKPETLAMLGLKPGNYRLVEE